MASLNNRQSSMTNIVLIIGGFRGVHPACAPPPRDPYFNFDIQILRNVATSGVHAPPPTGNPGSATVDGSQPNYNSELTQIMTVVGGGF